MKELITEKETNEVTVPVTRKKRKLYFRILKRLMKSRYKEPAFVYLGEKITTGGLIISNHEGTDAPMSLEIYMDVPLRMWGAHEMNSGVISMYKYQSQVYFHQRKHWNIHLARLFCLIASPLTNLFYSGLDLISTYRDARLVKTIRESIESIKNGDNIAVYADIADKGYLPVLEGFHEGFVTFASIALKKGIDTPIFVTYFRKSDCTYIIDAPVKFSELIKNGESREEVARKLCDRCNELGKMKFEESELNALREHQAKEHKEHRKKIS